MCGIIYAKRQNNKAVNKVVEDSYMAQKSRGSDGFGIVYIKRDGTYSVERFRKEHDALKSLRSTVASEILFHHRLPTSTKNYEFCTHPILVDNENLEYKYLVVHNGVATSPADQRKEHVQKGFVYNTDHYEEVYMSKGGTKELIGMTLKFNDSETVAIEMALAIEGKKEAPEFSGTAAVVVLQINKDTDTIRQIFWGHNTGNPLVYRVKQHKKGDSVVIASAGGGKDVEEGHLISQMFDSTDIKSVKFDFGKTYKTWTKYHQRDSTPNQCHFGYTQKDRPAALPAARISPKASDFDVIEPPPAYVQQINTLEDEINDLEVDLAIWQGELRQSEGASASAILAEITDVRRKLDKKQSELDALYDMAQNAYDGGIPSPYSGILS